MAQTIVGTSDFTEQPQRDHYEPGTGKVTTKTWLGPRENYDAVFDLLQASDPDTLDGVKGTPAEIVATYGPDESQVDIAIWELIPTPVDRPLATHPSFNTSGTQQEILEKIDKAVRAGVGQDTDWDTDYGLAGLNDYRNLLAKGTDSYRMWSYVVRRTYTSSLRETEQFDDTDAGLVVPWNSIPIPSTLKFAQPVYNRFDGVGAVVPVPIDQWLVSPATVRYERKKYTITKEWLGALGWYAILYSGGNALSTADGSTLG